MLVSSDTFMRKIMLVIHSSLDLEEVYQAVVDEVGPFLQADRCFISRFDPVTDELCAPTREYRSSIEVKSIIDEAPVSLWVSLSEYAAGLCSEPNAIAYQDVHHLISPEAKTQLEILQVRSGISVAIHFQKCLGVLFIQSNQADRVWHREEAEMLRLVAYQVGVATHHSDLYRQLEERSYRSQILNQLYHRAITGIEPSELFELALDQISESLGISISKIIQFSPKSTPAQPLKLQACRGLSPDLIGKHFDAGAEPHAAYTLEAEQPVIVTNIYQETRFEPSPLHIEYGLVSGVAVVIWGAKQPYGVLEIDSRQERSFSKQDVQFLESIAALLGTVLERKQLENLAYKSEQQFALMVQSLQDYAVAWLDPDGIIESWNRGAECIFGYSADEIIGQSCQLLYTEEDVLNQLPQQLLAAAAKQGQVTQEGPRRAKQGAIIQCEVTVTSLYEQGNQLLGYVGVARDISARKEAEAILKASEEVFRSLVEGSKDYAIYLEDANGYITSWNPGAESIYGYSAAEVLGQPFFLFLTPEEIQEGLPAKELKEAIENGRFETEGWRVRKDGSYFWASVILTALRNEQGDITGFTNITRDFTQRQLANETLKESQARFDRAVSGSDEGFWDWDVIHDSLYWSDRLYEMLGLTRQNTPLTYEVFESFLHPEDKEGVRLSMEHTVQDGVPYLEEFRMRHASGGYRYCYSRGKPYYDEKGKLIRVAGMIADITERKQTELALSIVQQRLTASLSAAQAGTFQWDIQTDTMNFDENLESIFGLSAGQTIKTFSDFIARVHPEDRPTVIQACEHSMRAGQECNIEYRVVWPAGSVHWLYEKGKIFFDAAGKASYLTGACIDITDKKLAEEQIKASYKALADLTNAVNVATIVAITDARGIITEINEAFCRISKYSREELLGQDHRILNSGYHSREFFQTLWTTIMQGQIWKGEIRNRAKDGSIYWVDTTIVPYLDEQGQPKQYVTIRHDITQRKIAEVRLRESNHDLEQFAAIASHDLQAPLRKVKLFSDMITEQIQDKLGPDDRDVLKRMHQSIETMQQLISDLLVLSRISLEPEAFQIVDLNQVIKQVSLNLEEKIQATHAQLNIGPLETVYGNQTQLTQLMQNLVENAIKYQSPGNQPMITIQADCSQENYCSIQVSDNGIGIPAEHTERIFQPFERLHGKTSIYQGSGIGLAICKRIVERHHGRISVISQVGEGSTFIVELPKMPQHSKLL